MDKIRCQADKPGQIAGQLAHDCGREMHTSGSQHRSKIFKFIAESLINTYFEQFALEAMLVRARFCSLEPRHRPKRFKKCQLFCLHFAIPRVY